MAGVGSGLGGGAIAVIGWDMTAVLAMARATGVPEALAADWLPEVEQMMAEACNRRPEGDSEDKTDG